MCHDYAIVQICRLYYCVRAHVLLIMFVTVLIYLVKCVNIRHINL